MPISPGIWLNKEENDIINLHTKFGTYTMYNIYKMADLNFMGFHQHPPPTTLERWGVHLPIGTIKVWFIFVLWKGVKRVW